MGDPRTSSVGDAFNGPSIRFVLSYSVGAAAEAAHEKRTKDTDNFLSR
jgi:hypothetical protein